MDDIGDEALVDIFSFVSPLYDLVNLSASCKSFRNLIFSHHGASLWKTGTFIICIEPTNKQDSKYLRLYPHNTVYRCLAHSLLSNCPIEKLQVHCYIDDIQLVIDTISLQAVIVFLHLYLNRGLKGSSEISPIDASINRFKNLIEIIIEPEEDSQSLPIQAISHISCYNVLSFIGDSLSHLHIYFLPPDSIFQLICSTCQQLEYLTIIGTDYLDFNTLKSNKLKSLSIKNYPIMIKNDLELPKLHYIDCILSDLETEFIESLLHLPISLEIIKIRFLWTFNINETIKTIGHRFQNLQILDMNILDEENFTCKNDFMNTNISIITMKILAIGCPLLHHIRLPICANFEQGAIRIFAEFSNLKKLYLWCYCQEVFNEDMEYALYNSLSIQEVIYIGLGPDEPEWDGLASDTEYIHMMLEWHNIKLKVNHISEKFQNIDISAVIYDELEPI